MFIGSNERSRRVDMSFDSFGQIWPTSGGEIIKIAEKGGFSKLVLVRATTFEQRSRRVNVPFDIFGQI